MGGVFTASNCRFRFRLLSAVARSLADQRPFLYSRMCAVLLHYAAKDSGFVGPRQSRLRESLPMSHGLAIL
jgi:hypothetical protein